MTGAGAVAAGAAAAGHRRAAGGAEHGRGGGAGEGRVGRARREPGAAAAMARWRPWATAGRMAGAAARASREEGDGGLSFTMEIQWC